MDMGTRMASGDPFVEVRSVDGINACAVIEFVRADVGHIIGGKWVPC